MIALLPPHLPVIPARLAPGNYTAGRRSGMARAAQVILVSPNLRRFLREVPLGVAGAI